MIKTSDGESRSDGGSMDDGDKSIHSHPIGKYNVKSNGGFDFVNALKPTEYDAKSNTGDVKVFERYKSNIIVGRLGPPKQDEYGNVNLSYLGMAVFDSKSEFQFKVSKYVIDKILDESGKNLKVKKKFEKKQAKNGS